MKHTIIIFSLSLAGLILLLAATRGSFHLKNVNAQVLGKFTVNTPVASGK